MGGGWCGEALQGAIQCRIELTHLHASPGGSSKVSMQSRQGKHSKQASGVGAILGVPAV